MGKPGARKLGAYRRGLWAERLAALYLRIRGYRILCARYKTPVGEIDLVAERRGVLVFAEVKIRPDIEAALCSVTPHARRRIERAAGHFMALNPKYAAYGMRFDVLALAPPFYLRHLDNAWQAGA